MCFLAALHVSNVIMNCLNSQTSSSVLCDTISSQYEIVRLRGLNQVIRYSAMAPVLLSGMLDAAVYERLYVSVLLRNATCLRPVH